MCFSRKTYLREEQSEGVREGPLWRLFDREHEAERPRPIADRDRAERDAEESRDELPVGIGA